MNALFWSVMRAYMRWRHGVRGTIKPPINWNRANSPWYRWRYFCWRIEGAIYIRTGLTKEWWGEVYGDNHEH